MWKMTLAKNFVENKSRKLIKKTFRKNLPNEITCQITKISQKVGPHLKLTLK